jgi:hypothetical protein
MTLSSSILPFRHRSRGPDTVYLACKPVRPVTPLGANLKPSDLSVPVYTQDGCVVAWRDKAACEQAARTAGGRAFPKTFAFALGVADMMNFGLMVVDERWDGTRPPRLWTERTERTERTDSTDSTDRFD